MKQSFTEKEKKLIHDILGPTLKEQDTFSIYPMYRIKLNRFSEGLKFSKRILTKQQRLFPNFIIIGAARSGTTSLYAYLISHPNVLSPVKKETTFFNFVYHSNIGWYRMYFPTLSEQEKMKKQRGLKTIITGEATPSYLIDPHVPMRISKMLPNVKLIVLLRNPIDRALSHYHHNVSLGIEKLSFEEAIKKEPERINESFNELNNEKFIVNENFVSYFLRLMTLKTRNYFKFLKFFMKFKLLSILL